jgi:hypothetical protein
MTPLDVALSKGEPEMSETTYVVRGPRRLDTNLRRKWGRRGFIILDNGLRYDVFDRLEWRTIHFGLTLDELETRMAELIVGRSVLPAECNR